MVNLGSLQSFTAEERLIVENGFQIITDFDFHLYDENNDEHNLALQYAFLVKDYACGEANPEKMLNLYMFNLTHFKWDLSKMLDILFSIEIAVKESLESIGLEPSVSWFERLTTIFFQLFNSHKDMQAEIDKLLQRNTILESRNSILEYKSSRDFLTTLSNYESFLEVLDTRLSLRKYKTSDTYLGVYMIDIDNFADCNTAFGHDGGDRVLQKISDVLRSIARREDEFVARRSGDEFLILIDNKTMKEVESFGELITKTVSDNPVNLDGEFFRVTCSVGGVCLQNSEGIDNDYLIKAADKALYEVKDSGRNDFVFGGEITKEHFG